MQLDEVVRDALKLLAVLRSWTVDGWSEEAGEPYKAGFRLSYSVRSKTPTSIHTHCPLLSVYYPFQEPTAH
jgi:hypothetical protein